MQAAYRDSIVRSWNSKHERSSLGPTGPGGGLPLTALDVDQGDEHLCRCGGHPLPFGEIISARPATNGSGPADVDTT